MKHDQETKFNLLIPPINPSDGEEGHWQPEGGHKVGETFPHHTFAKLGGVKDGMRGHQHQMETKEYYEYLKVLPYISCYGVEGFSEEMLEL